VPACSPLASISRRLYPSSSNTGVALAMSLCALLWPTSCAPGLLTIYTCTTTTRSVSRCSSHPLTVRLVTYSHANLLPSTPSSLSTSRVTCPVTSFGAR
jgi:hypothetical protein